MIKKFIKFINQPSLFGEIMRFVLVGGLATVIDFLAMAVVLYALQPELYDTFFNVFINDQKPSTLSNVIGTGVGFIFGLIANYLLSIVFVFNEKGKSKTTSGFIKFTIFSVIGLAIHEAGMAILNGLLGWDGWIVKILLTLVVLVYNYLTRRIFIFKKDDNTVSQTETATDKNASFDTTDKTCGGES